MKEHAHTRILLLAARVKTGVFIYLSFAGFSFDARIVRRGIGHLSDKILWWHPSRQCTNHKIWIGCSVESRNNR